MTIEEKARNYAGYDVMPTPDIVTEIRMTNIRDDFKAGAEWMLEKAFYLLKDHAGDYAITAEAESGSTYSTIDFDLFTDFKKEMEG